MNSVTGFGSILGMLIELYSFVILARVLMSWVNVDPYSPLARVIFDLTEPVLAPVRNLLPPAAGLDFSPIIVLVLLQIVGSMLINMFH
jgi:YggT family protein